MKKLFYTLIASLPFFTSCEEADFGVKAADPQSWEQEEAITLPGLAISAASAIDFADVTDSVTVFSYTEPSNLPEGTTIENFNISLAPEGSETAVATFKASNNGKIAAADLKSVIEKQYGKRPEERTLTGTVTANLMYNGQASLLSSAPITIKATLVAPFIDSAYYLIGNMNEWNGDALIKLNHSGADVYDDPIFSTIVEVPADCYWKVIPETNVAAGNIWDNNFVLGCAENGSTDLTGALVINPNPEPGAMRIENAGWVKISLNMMDYTYTVELLGEVSPYLYTPGNHQGWNPAASAKLYSTDFMSYTGYLSLDGEFKFTSAPDWDHINYGDGGNGTLSTSGGNLSASKGFYYAEANVTTLTWKVTEITTYGIIGGFNDWSASLPMTFDAATSTYTVEAELPANTEFKFRANDDWAINLGGTLGNLVPNGGNIMVAEAGTYTITLDLSDAANLKATMVKK